MENGGSRIIKSKWGITKDVCGRASREGAPRGEMAKLEVAEDIKAESTNTDVGEATYIFGKVHEAERSPRRAMRPRKDRATRTGIISNEVRRMTVPNQGSG